MYNYNTYYHLMFSYQDPRGCPTSTPSSEARMTMDTIVLRRLMYEYALAQAPIKNKKKYHEIRSKSFQYSESKDNIICSEPLASSWKPPELSSRTSAFAAMAESTPILFYNKTLVRL